VDKIILIKFELNTLIMTDLENKFLDDDYRSREYIKRERSPKPGDKLTYKEVKPLLKNIFGI